MNNFQKTLFEKVPSDWDVSLVPDVCFFQEGPGLLRKQFGNSGNGIPFINIRCIKEDGTIDRRVAQFVKKSEVEAKYKHFLLEEGDYVLSTSGTLGRLALVKSKDVPMLLNTSVIRFRSIDEEKLDKQFLRHLLKSSLFFDQLAAESQGSAQVNVGPTHIQKCYFVLPPLREQESIANILDSVDKVIELTEKEISKLQDLKKGIDQSIFNLKNIDDKNWKYESTIKVAKKVTVGHVGETASGYSEEGIPFFRTGNVRPGYINYNNMKFITDEFHNKLSKSQLFGGMVLISRVGANLGMAATVPRSIEVANCANVLVIHFDEEKVLPEYFCYYVNSNFGQESLLERSIGSAQGVINTKTLETWSFPLPTLDEQKAIFEFVTTVDISIQKKTRKKDNLINIKKGLMQDLLTGKVRVNI